jgi:istB domain protein ATP-binding protein
MTNDILNSLLRDYERKKLNAELDLERRKDLIYKLIPRLLEIDTELNSLGIQSAKSILFSPEKKDFYLNDLNKKIKDLKDEKEFILIKNGYSKDYFEPFYECKLCNDTGFVTDENFKTSMCSCLKQKLLNISFNKSNMYNLKKENFENFNDSFFSDEVDLSKYKFNISPRKNIQNIKNKSIEFIKNFDNSDSKNLLFTGATGLR